MERDEPGIRMDVVEQLILAMVRLDRESIARLRGVTIRHQEREAAQTLLLALMTPTAVYLTPTLGKPSPRANALPGGRPALTTRAARGDITELLTWARRRAAPAARRAA